MVELIGKPGEQVRIRMSDRELECVLLESPDSRVLLVKLASGYNIGIPKEHVLDMEVLVSVPERAKPKRVVIDTKLPTISLIVTGGTIASTLDRTTGAVKPLSQPDELLALYPELLETAQLKRVQVPFLVASESMNSGHWKQLAEAVYQELLDDEVQGVVVTHGTDTLHYTAAALSFFLPVLNKPIVLTYSQRSSDRASSDARLNLVCATRMALSPVAEVMLVGHATSNDDFCYALRGVKTRKMHTSKRDAFQPVNGEPIAKVWKDRIELTGIYRARSDTKPVLDAVFSDSVALVTFYPGQSPAILDYYASQYKGIIIQASGLGHLPVNEARESWIPALKKHIKAGLIVGITAQTIQGRLNPLVYSNGRELLATGVIPLGDMLSEVAFVKLGWILGHYGWKKQVREKLLTNVAGELSERLTA